MIIETKYDIGQEFYYVLFFSGSRSGKQDYFDIMAAKIEKLLITKENVRYIFNTNINGRTRFDEENIKEWQNNNIMFTTRELAQAECTRRNQKGESDD